MSDFYKTLPNKLTWFRIVLIFALFSCYLQGYLYLVAPIFVLAALTDWLDGFLARRWQVESDFGAFLDPVADKLIVSCALIILVDAFSSKALLSFVTLIILREVSMSSLRHWASSFRKKSDIPVSLIGKTKTASQLVGVTILLGQYNFQAFSSALSSVGTGILGLSALLGWISFTQYYLAVMHSETI